MKRLARDASWRETPDLVEPVETDLAPSRQVRVAAPIVVRVRQIAYGCAALALTFAGLSLAPSLRAGPPKPAPTPEIPFSEWGPKPPGPAGLASKSPKEREKCSDFLIQGKGCGWAKETEMELRCELASKRIQAEAYVTERSANAVIALARARGVHTVLRPVTPDAPALSGEGHIGKPMYVKWKSCSAEDQFLGAPLGCFGMVLLYRPDPPPADVAAFETRRMAILGELEKLLTAPSTTPFKRQSLAKLITAVRAATLASVVKRHTARTDEAHALDGKDSAFEVNVYRTRSTTTT